MAFAKFAGEGQRVLAISGTGRTRHLQQLVRDSGHGADHNHRSLRQASPYNLCRAIDRLGILNRGPAEFHHDHRPMFLEKGAARISNNRLMAGMVCLNPGIPAL